MEQSKQFKEEQLPLLEDLKPYTGAVIKFNDIKSYIENYFDKNQPRTITKSGTIQCKARRRRSVLDIYYLTKAKFSEVTLSEVAFIMLNLVCKPKLVEDSFLVATYCSTVQKFVFFKSSYPSWYKIFKFTENGFESESFLSEKAPIDGITQEDIIALSNEHFNFLKQQKQCI